MVKTRLDSFPIPVRLCIGNHDNRTAFLSVFPDLAAEDGFVQGVHDTPAARCLFLDTTICRPMRAAIARTASAGLRHGWKSMTGRSCCSCTTIRCRPISPDGPDSPAR